MKLKTLKDLVSWCCECNCVTFDGEVCRSCGKSSPKYGEIDFDELKQEAIKWAKKRSEPPFGTFCEFFNITVEELK